MSCRFAHDAGAYVLGALSPAERLAFERHLDGCEECTSAVRDFAGIPALLGRVDATLLETRPLDEPAPDLVPSLVRAVRRRRRRRTLAVAGLAAAAAAAVAVPVTVSQVADDGVGTPEPSVTATAEPEAMEPVGEVPVEATVLMEDVAWGTRLRLSCSYEPDSVEYELPPEVDYVLVVRTRDGETEQVGSWKSVDGATMRLAAGTAASREDIESVEVRTPGGRVVLTLGT
ncbi:zf-HC2 domain-containing protein [Georgenia halophila]|uniref:Zf-HC2 domain-containing protein n=1 Tax=Georgenia halophila TaxID=620889 RepID=A0ABP8LN73_9MICO